LLRYHLDQDTNINHILFDPTYEPLIRQYFDGIMGAFSTAEHFLGKLKLELAVMGVNKEDNLQVSRGHLLRAIKMDTEIRGAGVEETVGYGFKELARNYLAAGNIKEADKALEEAIKHFEAYTKTTPRSNVLIEL